MAGPNVIQSEEHCLKMCRQIKAVTGAWEAVAAAAAMEPAGAAFRRFPG